MADLELGSAVTEYQNALTREQQVASLKKISSQVKHKALAESTAVSIINIVAEAIGYGSDVREAALALLGYLVRRIHSQGQLSLSKVAAALNSIPNWPDILTDLRKRGVPTDVRNQLQEALERPPSSGSSHIRPAAAERKQASQPSGTVQGKSAPVRSMPVMPPENGLEAIYVSSASNLDQICHEMLPDFEGKESEFNWPRRDKHILKLRQILKGNAPSDYPNALLANWKILFEGIVKCATSLRTTFSTGSCQFVQEAVATLGHGIDMYAGRLLEMSVKMCGDTKPIAAQNGNNCVLALVNHLSWTKHMMTIITDACQDKNARPREFAYGWLKAAFLVHGHRKATLEQSHGADAIEKCFRRGISDTNPKVRETARKAFWDFHSVWPTRGDALLTSLDDRTQKAIRSSKPDGGAVASAAAAAAPLSAAGPAKARPVAAKPSIRDVMAAKRREKAMERPQSALASFPSAEAKSVKKPTAPAHRPAHEPSAVGGLSSAPVRPGRKVISRAISRPEMSTTSAAETDRPKTPFRSGVPRRPESRADDKRAEPLRRPATAASRPATVARPAPARRIPAPSSLPASPEKVLVSPASRRPKSITEDSPIFQRTHDLPDRTRLGTPPSALRTIKTLDSPLHGLASSSRLSTPARVYEDPRTSPSPSPQLAPRIRTPTLAPRGNASKAISNVDINTGSRPSTAEGKSLNGGESFSPVKMPLSELSTNEISTPNSDGKGDPRSAKLIDSGIVHMKSGRLDPHGYRKLHAAVMDSIDAISPTKFDELLTTIINAAPAGQENSSDNNPSVGSERILIQRLHLLSALGKSPQIQGYMSQVLRALIHVVRHDARHDGHTYWVAEGQLREFASVIAAEPNDAARGVLAQPQDPLHSTVLKCMTMLAENKRFDRDDGELVSIVAELAGEAVALDKDVDARIQGHQLAKALGVDTVQKYLGEERTGVAFMLYQSTKADA